jgi:hypothetical protein
MGTILASKIATDAAKDLHDPGFDRFVQDDHLEWINEGQREAVKLKPDVNTITDPVGKQLVAGTKQSLEEGELSLIKLVRNMGTDGQTPGKPITFVDMDHFSLHNPEWQTARANTVVSVYMLDDRFPREFYVYPPQPSSDQGYVERVVVKLPSDIALIGDPITIEDQYESVLYDYNMFRALSINAKSSPLAKSESLRHWNSFVTALDRKDLVEKIISPTAKKGVKA